MPYKNKEVRKKYHREYMRKYRKKYPYYKNGGRYFKKYRDWIKKNIEHKKEYDKKYFQTKIGKMVKIRSIKKYNETSKGKASKQRAQFKRLTKIKDSINTLIAQEWLDILEEHNHRCAYCDVEFEVENMPTKDHIIPLSKGGHNTKENVMPACRSCNSKKWNKLIKPFPTFNLSIFIF